MVLYQMLQRCCPKCSLGEKHLETAIKSRLRRNTMGTSSTRLLSTAAVLKRSSAPALNPRERESSPLPVYNRSVTLDTINPAIKAMEYVVRGPIILRAAAIQKELKQGVKKPFKEAILANIGDCQAMGQKPITFLRQVLGLVCYPPFFNDPSIPEDAKQRAHDILSAFQGQSAGAYTECNGIELVRRDIARYIQRRDGGSLPDPNDIILTAGATGGIKTLLSLLRCSVDGKNAGVLTPIPQYPMYSATLSELEMDQVGYYLHEEDNWGLDMEELRTVLNEARESCYPRALVVINPGNPTGQVLSYENIREIIKFAFEEKLVIFADEVYQYNVYEAGSKFYSFKKVMNDMGPPYDQLELYSFMSCSKGYMGECGIRAGYVEVNNMCPDVKTMLLKSFSAQVCPNTVGQACMDVMVNPPKPGEPSYEQFFEEKCAVLDSLKARAEMMADALNSFEGFTCNPVQGAMYAFPQVRLPEKVIEAARVAGQEADVFYAYQLLEQTGICIVPGSGFGQRSGTYHFRITILPPPEMLQRMLVTFRSFHENFLRLYK